MKGKELAQLARQNRKKVTILQGEIEAINTSTRDEVYHIQYNVFQPQIRELEQKCRDEMAKVANAGEALQGQKREEVKSLMEPVKQVERILEFLRIDTTQDLNITDEEIKPPERYRERYRENLGVVFNDPYLKIRLFILENDKPKNKYILVLIGKCLFDNGMGDRQLLKLPRDYGIDGAPWGSSPQHILKEAASVEDLKTWWHTNGFKKVTWLPDYLKVKAEYDHVKKTYRLDDFNDFLTFTCPACGNFYTVFDNYHQDSEAPLTCHRCSSNESKSVMLEVKHGS